jgi:hypothetical protein
LAALRFAALVVLSVLAVQCAAPVMSGTPVTSLSEIDGAWDIVSFDDYRPARLDADGNRHAFVDIIADGSFAFTIGCNYSGLRGSIDESGRLVEVASDDFHTQTAMGCGVEREGRDEAFFQFFRTKPTIVQTGDDLVLHSGATRLVLQRPAMRRTAALPVSLEPITGPWSAGIVYFEVEPGHSRNLLAAGEVDPAVFDISTDQIMLRFDCEHVSARVRLAAPGSLAFTPAQRNASAPCRLPQSDRDLVASLLSGDAELERIDQGGLHLVAGRVRAVLNRKSSQPGGEGANSERHQRAP